MILQILLNFPSVPSLVLPLGNQENRMDRQV